MTLKIIYFEKHSGVLNQNLAKEKATLIGRLSNLKYPKIGVLRIQLFVDEALQTIKLKTISE